MKYVELENINKRLSVIYLGTGNYGSKLTRDTCFRLLDRFAELGGTFIDTAHVYGAWDLSGYNGGYGNSEKVIGEWLQKEGMQKKIAVGTKGGHPDLESGINRMNSEDINTHICDSLQRLKTDAIDLYWLHTDDPSIPAGEILGMLAEHKEAGLIKAIGCSNWSIKRQQEAVEAAATFGLPGFVASQVGWSLARASDAVYRPGHIDMWYMNAAMYQYHVQTGIPVAGYSAQGGGFFAQKYDGLEFDSPDFPSPALRERYGNSLSYKRRQVAVDLARQKGCSANQVALAWMIHQPFDVFPIAGPNSLAQMDDSMKAGEIELTNEELKSLTCGQRG